MFFLFMWYVSFNLFKSCRPYGMAHATYFNMTTNMFDKLKTRVQLLVPCPSQRPLNFKVVIEWLKRCFTNRPKHSNSLKNEKTLDQDVKL